MLSFKWDPVILLSLPEDLIDVDIDENDTAVADHKNTDSSTNISITFAKTNVMRDELAWPIDWFENS